MAVIAVYSTKGGVGKTTAAVNLAYEAARTHRVLLWDLDPQGASTFLLKVKPKVKGGAEALIGAKGSKAIERAIRETDYDNLDVLPADESYRDLEIALSDTKKASKRIEKALGPVADDYDLIVLDCPPGASLLARNVVRAADAVVTPLVPAPLSLRSLEQVRNVVGDSADPALVIGFLSGVDRRKKQHREVSEQLPAQQPDVVDVAIPATVTVERMGSERAPVAAFAPKSAAAAAFTDLWSAVEASL